MIKKCENCSEEFKARKVNTRFCSAKCKSQNKGKLQKAERRQKRIDELGERLVVVDELMQQHNILYYQATKIYENNLNTIPERYGIK